MIRYAIVAVVLASVSAAHADAMPSLVQSAVAEAKASCKPEHARISDGFLRKLDVNGDGIPDYVLSYEAVTCPDAGRLNCGSAGCLTQVFASTPHGYAKVLDENVQQVRFRQLKGSYAMLLGLHGSSCGKAGAELCGATLYWNGERFGPAH